jgi:(2Fe-2S) ferredoxin
LVNGVRAAEAKEITLAFVGATLVPPVVAKPVLVPTPEAYKTKILVCQKSDCCRRGSAELRAAIETVIDDRNLGQQVCVKAVGCMKQCSNGPVMAIGKKKYKAAEVKDVERFLDERFAPSPEIIPAA